MPIIGDKVDFEEINTEVISVPAGDHIYFNYYGTSGQRDFYSMFVSTIITGGKQQIAFTIRTNSANNVPNYVFIRVKEILSGTVLYQFEHTFPLTDTSYYYYINLPEARKKELRLDVIMNASAWGPRVNGYIRRAFYPLEDGMYIRRVKTDYSDFETGDISPSLNDFNNNLHGGEF